MQNLEEVEKLAGEVHRRATESIDRRHAEQLALIADLAAAVASLARAARGDQPIIREWKT